MERVRRFLGIFTILIFALAATLFVFAVKKKMDRERALSLSGIAVPDDVGDDTMLEILGNFYYRRAPGVSESEVWQEGALVTARTGPVKDQGQCSSCWAFALASMIEDRKAIYEGKDPSTEGERVSPQSLLDVATRPSNRIPACYSQSKQKCQCGESPWYATQLTEDYGFVLEGCASYRARNISAAGEPDEPVCFTDEHRNCYYVDSYDDYFDACPSVKFRKVYMISGESNAARELFHNGSVMCIVGIHPSFFNFTSDSGVIEKDVNDREYITTQGGWHAVVIVGLQRDEGGLHWVIKNSWGTGRGAGDNGFVRARYGENVLCMADWPFFVGTF
jgi:hypothetical protein